MKALNYWYSAQPNEIFLDLDSRSALLRAMKIIRASDGELTAGVWVKKVYHYPSGRPGHSHVILILDNPSGTAIKPLLALWLGSDVLRTCYVFSRLHVGAAHSDLLISKKTYHRFPDAACDCEGKHKDKAVTDNCPALQVLLGEWRSLDFFTRAGRQRMSKMRFPTGRVPLTLLKKWKGQHAKRR